MYINSSLIAQFIVFILLVWFTMRFIWPPIINALDERSNNIAEGLAAAEKGRLEFAQAEKEVTKILADGRHRVSDMISHAEKEARRISDNAREKSLEESQKILERARIESLQEIEKVKLSLANDVSHLVILSVEKILRREININNHKDILDNIKDDMKKDFLNDRI